MSRKPEPTPAPPPDAPDELYFAWVREKAHLAIRIELRDFDWMSLNAETARKIHALLPSQF